jgi:hypothetical protein
LKRPTRRAMLPVMIGLTATSVVARAIRRTLKNEHHLDRRHYPHSQRRMGEGNSDERDRTQARRQQELHSRESAQARSRRAAITDQAQRRTESSPAASKTKSSQSFPAASILGHHYHASCPGGATTGLHPNSGETHITILLLADRRAKIKDLPVLRRRSNHREVLLRRTRQAGFYQSAGTAEGVLRQSVGQVG